ncbi:PREDICTED: probable phosphatidylinositol 4-kinase type 2-beta At1g26270-like [Fragaria vesca subsp. vesca]
MGMFGFWVHDLHKTSQLDIRLSNTDRNLGNILRAPEGHLLPIDHGYCLPNKYGDVTIEWLYWDQAKLPYGSDVIEYVNTLDAEIDIQLLKRYGWNIPHGCARTLRISTMLLKKGVKRGLSPFDLGSILSRTGYNTLSLIEKIMQEVEVVSEASFLKTVSSIMDRHLANRFGDL